MSDLVEPPEDRFSHNEPRIIKISSCHSLISMPCILGFPSRSLHLSINTIQCGFNGWKESDYFLIQKYYVCNKFDYLICCLKSTVNIIGKSHEGTARVIITTLFLGKPPGGTLLVLSDNCSS